MHPGNHKRLRFIHIPQVRLYTRSDIKGFIIEKLKEQMKGKAKAKRKHEVAMKKASKTLKMQTEQKNIKQV